MNIWQNLSLRSRLTILYSGLLIVIVVILGITFFIDTKGLLIEITASHIRARAKPIIEHWLYRKHNLPPTSHYLKKIADYLARDLTSKNTTALILDSKGRIIANGKRLPEEPSPPKPNAKYYLKALGGENEITYIVSQDSQHTLVVLIPLRQSPTSSNILGIAQLSCPLSPVEHILLSHTLYLSGISIMIICIGSVFIFLLTTSSLKGLVDVINTCKKISKGNLKQRVNLPKTKDEIGKLASAFDHMVERIESIFESQHRFIANAAHELRTPLTALRGSLEVLLRRSQNDPEATARLLYGMYHEVIRLHQLCEQLLDLARLDISSKIQKEPLKIDEFLKEFFKQAKLLTNTHNLSLSKGPNVTIFADPNLLRQVMFNLLSNAIQNTSAHGSISLGWKKVSGYVEIWVQDTGKGIDPEDLPFIFEPFYRGKENTSGKKGTGLGLAIVKATVEAHGGYVKVDSQKGKGTRFTIVIPA